MRQVDEPEVNCDLCESSFEWACTKLGCAPWEAKLYAGTDERCRAQHIQGKYGCALRLVPTEMMRSRSGWLVEYNGRLFGSDGSC